MVKSGDHRRCMSDAPRTPGDDIVISTSQVAEGFAVVEGEVDTGFTGSTCGMREWEQRPGYNRRGRTWVGKESTLPGRVFGAVFGDHEPSFPADSFAQSRGTSK